MLSERINASCRIFVWVGSMVDAEEWTCRLPDMPKWARRHLKPPSFADNDDDDADALVDVDDNCDDEQNGEEGEEEEGGVDAKRRNSSFPRVNASINVWPLSVGPKIVAALPERPTTRSRRTANFLACTPFWLHPGPSTMAARTTVYS
jgi:hypothetical protein